MLNFFTQGSFFCRKKLLNSSIESDMIQLYRPSERDRPLYYCLTPHSLFLFASNEKSKSCLCFTTTKQQNIPAVPDDILTWREEEKRRGDESVFRFGTDCQEGCIISCGRDCLLRLILVLSLQLA